jgi:hypothetical protein
MSDSLAITLHSSGAETASGSGTAVDLQGEDGVECRRFVELRLVISAFSATTLEVAIETSADGSTWSTVANFADAAATGSETVIAGDCDRYVRVSWTLTGASATFGVAGTADVTYCPIADLGHANVLPSSLTAATKIRYLREATQETRNRLLAKARAPIVSVGPSVKRAVAKMAVVSLLVEEVGLNPQSDAHVALFTERDRAVGYIKDMAAGRAARDFTDSTPDTHEGTGSTSTGTARGWGSMSVR